MHIWTDLAAREAAYLALLFLLGSGPVSFLGQRFDAGSRLALAPLLGFCVGTCVTTTLLQFEPANSTYWIVIPVALASAAVAFRRTRRADGAPGWRARLPRGDLLAMVLVAVAVAAPVTYVLHERGTVGPAAYYYTDVDNYVGTQDGAQTTSLHTARTDWNRNVATGRPPANLTQYGWWFLANIGSNLDATPLDANVNALLGLSASDTYAPFLIVLLLAGALGAFAAVRYWARSRTWLAVLAGAMFGGPLFLELWFDGYQAAIIANGLAIPFIVLTDSVISTRRRGDIGLLALFLATYLTTYPLYVAPLLGAVALMLIWKGVELRRAGRPLRGMWRPLAITAATVVLLAIAFDAVGFIRDIRYYDYVLDGQIALPRVGYHLRLSVIPGWIAQTREFWNMPPLGSAGAKQLLIGGVLPLVFLGFAAVALRRYRAATALVGLAGVCAVLAEYTYLSQQNCTYCAERDLLPLGPIAAVLIALGLGALIASGRRRTQVIGALGVLLVIGAVSQRARVELQRFANSSYFMDTADRTLLGRVPRGAGAIEEEGFGASTYAQAEQPLVYHLIDERWPGRASVVLGSNLGNAIQYLDFSFVEEPPAPSFDPNYRYVLTRFAGVATDRRVLARDGGIALEERTQPLDVTPYGGLGVPLARLNPSGDAWVQTAYPLQLLVVGDDDGRTAWARLTFSSVGTPGVPPQPGVRARVLDGGHTLITCIRAAGTAPYRRASITIHAPLTAGMPPPGLFGPVMPLEGLKLVAMRAVAGSCSV